MSTSTRALTPALLAALVVAAGCERCGRPTMSATAPADATATQAAPTPSPADPNAAVHPERSADAEAAARSRGATATPADPNAAAHPERSADAEAAARSRGAPPAPPSPVAAILREVIAVEPGGPPVPLHADARTTVDPAASFRVELSTPVPDARLLLLDGSDSLVAAEGTHEVGASTRLTLAPTSPLVPGSRYTLRLDGAVTRDLHATDGRVFAPLAHPLLTAGTPPPKEAKPAPKKKTRARR